MAYEVKLDQFEGSLDLLLYLIRTNMVNIYDIPIAVITDQYLSTIRQWQEMDLDIASDFIVMASRLIEIKSKMLLPRNQLEEEDPREELVSQLIDYQIYKAIGGYIREKMAWEDQSFYKDPDELPQADEPEPLVIQAESLRKAMARLFADYKADHTFRSDTPVIVRDTVTIEAQIEMIKEKLALEKPMEFRMFIKEQCTLPEIIVTFQALLELYKQGEIEIYQNGLFGEITVLQGGRSNGRETDFDY